MRYKLAGILCLLLFCAAQGRSQSLSFFDLDTSSYPLMKGKFFAFDPSGTQVSLAASDLTLTDDGANRPILALSCPSIPTPRALSSVLVVDVSGSMSVGLGSAPNIVLAQSAARAWINALPLGESECALTSFDHLNYLNHDFTTDRSDLLNAVNTLAPMGGTDYDEGLLLPFAGGLQVSKTGKHQRVIIFLTDGQPQHAPSTAQIIAEAKQQNCIIYAVTLGMRCPQSLKDISSQTGGNWFELVTTVEQAESIYRQILFEARSGAPCELTWMSGGCTFGERTAELKWSGQSSSSTYTVPVDRAPMLRFSPVPLAIRSKRVGVPFDTTITVTADNAPFTVTGITSTNPAYDINPKSFALAAGESRSLTVRYTPPDSGFTFAEFDLATDGCPQSYYASGGYPGKAPLKPTLKLDVPNGGESFVVGSDTAIAWSGLPATDHVLLDYSTDAGTTWKSVASNTSGKDFMWHVPRTPSTRCLARVRRLKDGDPDATGLIAALTDHNDAVTDAAWSPDGTRVATASFDFTAKIWNAATGSAITTLTGHAGPIDDIVWSPDGTKVLTAGEDEAAYIWDAATGAQLHFLSGHVAPIFQVDWSSDGSRVATASLDGTTKIWNASTGALLKTLGGNQSYVVSVRFSPDGKRVASSTITGEVRIYDVASGSQLFNLVGHTQRVLGLAWSPDGSRLATGGFDYSAKIWNTATGALAFNLSHPSGVFDVAFTPDGAQLATASLDNNARTWNVATGALVKTFTGHTDIIDKVAWNGDGSRLATASDDASLKVWNPATGALIRTFLGHTGPINTVEWSPDGLRLLSGSEDATARIWSVDEMPDLVDSSDAVFSIVMPSPAAGDVDMGKVLVGSGKDSVVTAFVRNTGTYPFRVDSIAITGGNASQFSIVSGQPPFMVPANGSYPVEFSFQPASTGSKSSQLKIYTQASTLAQTIRGEGVAPALEVVDTIIDFGGVTLGASKDTTRAVTIRNAGTAPLAINTTRHAGPNDKDFTTLAGGGPFTLAPGDTAHLDLRFTPSDSGRTSGRLLFEYNGVGSPATVELFGQGVTTQRAMPILAIVNDTIDFGAIAIGGSRDSLRAMTITNRGTAPLTITGTHFGGSDPAAFAALAGGGAFTLLPGDTARFDLRCTPSAVGPIAGQLLFDYGGSGSPAVVQLIALGVDASAAQAALEPGSAAAAPGDTVDIPILLSQSVKVASSGATRFTTRLRFNSTLLEPIESTPRGSLDGNDRVIDLDLPTSADTANILVTLRFRAGLGNDTVTALTLESPRAVGGAVAMSVGVGEFHLLGVCMAGGARLINPSGVIALKPLRPNPVNGPTVNVELETTELGPTRLYLSDMRGSTVRTLIDGAIAPGRRIMTFDLGDLSSGMYFMTLETPTERRTIRMEVAR
jgi:WD40 repeat protein